MGTAYRNEPVNYNINTRQSSKYWWASTVLAFIPAFLVILLFRLYLYHYLEIFGAQCLGLRILKRKVLGLKLIKTLLRILKSRSQILKPGSHSLMKSSIYHHIWGVGVGGGGVLGLIITGYVPLASQHPYPNIVYSVVNHRPPPQPLWGKYVIFMIPIIQPISILMN